MNRALRFAVLAASAWVTLGATPDRRVALLDQAESALSSGDTDRAVGALDSAALMAHSPDTELLQVRAMMQMGQYSRATAFAAHAAGDHHEGPVPAELYAWLLVLGGQEDIGRRRLAEVMLEAPTDAIGVELQRLVTDPGASMSSALFEPPHRFAPYATGASPPAAAKAAGTGVLWKDTLAVVVAPEALTAKHLWVRNGLGHTVAVKSTRILPGSDGLIALELQSALDPGTVVLAATAPYAGSPGFVADYPSVDHASSAWPRLHHGFFGGITVTSSVQRLGIGLPPGPRGGPVFDRTGSLAGIAVSRDGVDTLISAASVTSALKLPGLASQAAAASPAPPFDVGYERAMRIALQLIVEEQQ